MFYCFIIGIILGSFICAYAYRFINNESIVIGRSHCENCGKTLNWYELIPIVSFIMLKGRCTACHHKIRLMHLISEIIGGCIAIFAYIKYGICLNMFFITYICFILELIAIIDYYTMDVYEKHIVMLLIGVIAYVYVNDISILLVIRGLCILSIPLFIINKLFIECIGYGDLQLMSVLGMMLGDHIYYMFMIASLIASSHIFIYKFKNVKIMPFVPYLACSTYLILLF